MSGPVLVASARAEPANPSFAGFEVIEELSAGVGGMGRVYKAKERSLDRIVALKVVQPQLNTPQGLGYFEREAHAAACLDHPNILKVFRFQPEHNPPFYVMQFLEGRGLIQACRGRDFRFVAGLIEKIARALGYAHSRGAIHRDIKPDNVLVDQFDEPHICDFGVAGRIELEAGPQQPSATLVGTPTFIAPEVYGGDADVGPAIDIYAVGVTLYQLLTGRLPYLNRQFSTLREEELRAEPPLPVEVNPSVPEAMQRICLKAMELDPAMRYESADAMADDLKRFREGREVLAKPTRYHARLLGRIENHLADLRLWREQRLIDVRDMDRLSRPYHLLIETASPLSELSRRFPWESIALRLGGWLVLISSLLWPVFYWHRLTRGQRVWAIGAPALMINLCGWVLRWRGSRANSLIYLSTGALLLPLWVSVLLSEYGIAAHIQGGGLELLWQDGKDALDVYAPTNLQLTLSACAFTVYCIVLLLSIRAWFLSVWVAIGIYVSYSCILLTAGLKYWILHEQVAHALVLLLPLPLCFWPLSMMLEKRGGTQRWSAAFYAFFPIPFALVIDLLARYGAIEWLGAEPSISSVRVNQAIMLAGVIFLLTALYGGQNRRSYVRFWGAVLLLLVPIHVLTPTQILFDKPGHDLFRIADAPLTSYEAASALIAVALIVAGTRLRQAVLIFPALLGLATFFFRATDRHFREYLSWPAAVAATGALAMIVALASFLIRSRRDRERII
ncbi:MAG TPA: serine/threonine-protein kinase [Tepidisphaeraceae bacterium]